MRVLASLVVCGTALALPLGAQTAPPPRPAQALITEAIAQAKRERKVVIVAFGASWCGPCHEWNAFLAAPQVDSVMRRYYVIVSLTALEFTPAKKASENPGATALLASMDPDGAVPWFYFLDSAGVKLADSDVEPPRMTDIGYPDTAVEIEAFDQLLRKTAPNMTAAERKLLHDYLVKAGSG